MKKLFALILLIASASLQGCMTYSHHSLQTVDQWPLASPEQEKPSVYLKVFGEYQVNDNPRVSTADVAKLEQVISQTLSESGRFSRVTTAQEESDLYLTVTLHNHETGNMGLAVLTGALGRGLLGRAWTLKEEVGSVLKGIILGRDTNET